MDAETSGLWWVVAIVTGAVGTAMTVYGIRQREPFSLVFGISIGAVPMFVSSGWAALLMSAGITAIFIIVRKYR
jgi:hypothetical protein